MKKANSKNKSAANPDARLVFTSEVPTAGQQKDYPNATFVVLKDAPDPSKLETEDITNRPDLVELAKQKAEKIIKSGDPVDLTDIDAVTYTGYGRTIVMPVAQARQYQAAKAAITAKLANEDETRKTMAEFMRLALFYFFSLVMPAEEFLPVFDTMRPGGEGWSITTPEATVCSTCVVDKMCEMNEWDASNPAIPVHHFTKCSRCKLQKCCAASHKCPKSTK